MQEKTLWLETAGSGFPLQSALSCDIAQRIDKLEIAHRECFTFHSKDCAAMFLSHSSKVLYHLDCWGEGGGGGEKPACAHNANTKHLIPATASQLMPQYSEYQ